MANTTTNSASNGNFSSGPYLSALAIFTASRASNTATSVTVSCSLYVGFGSSANTGSILGTGYSMTARMSAPVATSYTTIKSSSSSWGYCTNVSAKFNSSYSATGKKPFLNSGNPFSFSATVSGWTSGSKTATVQIVDGDGATHSLSATLSCPAYSEAPTTITYTVAYNGNGSTSGSTASSSHTSDISKTLTTNGYIKNGYLFRGWATSQARANAGIVDFRDKQEVSNLTFTNGATVTLYAVWAAPPFSARIEDGWYGSNKIWVNINGAWKPVISVFVREGSVWKEV